jgi:uncharacterized membrane protein
MKRVGVVLILILAFCGVADSAYITEHALNGTPLLCSIQNLSGCNIVASSQYSHIYGIPLAEFGVVFYGIIFILAALEIVIFDQLLRRFLQGISVIGVLFSLYFTAIQVFVIEAVCIYCFISALIALCIFILATLVEPVRMRSRAVQPPSSNVPPQFTMPPKI